MSFQSNINQITGNIASILKTMQVNQRASEMAELRKQNLVQQNLLLKSKRSETLAKAKNIRELAKSKKIINEQKIAEQTKEASNNGKIEQQES